MSANEDDLRADLEAALDEQEKGQEEVAEEVTEETSEEVSVEAGSEAGDDRGAAASVDAGDGEGSEDGSGSEDSSSGADDEEARRDEARPESPLLRAPQSWRAPLREKWGDLPNDVREEIHRRESDFATTIQKQTETTKYGETMQQVLRPFESVMAMENATPFQAVQSLAQTAATLRMGTPGQKAATIKKLMDAYEVDVEVLDRTLVGEESLPPEQQALANMLDKRMAPLEQMLQDVQQGRQQYQQQSDEQISSEVEAFSSDSRNEFYRDVRTDMADLIELAHRRGVSLTLPEAYDRAVAARPELKQILDTRSAAERLASKKAAAISLKPTTPSVSNDDAPTDLRSVLERAWDSQSA